MKIEILYPEICTLYGDKGNTMYLQKCLPDAEFVTTGLNEKPLFLRENIDMVYMCSMSEKSQELVLDRLMQYKDEIAACMKDGKALFLLVGNSMELLGDYIKREDGTRVTGLGVVPGMYSVRQAPNQGKVQRYDTHRLHQPIRPYLRHTGGYDVLQGGDRTGKQSRYHE